MARAPHLHLSYTVLIALGASALVAPSASAEPVALPRPVIVDPNAKLINVSGTSHVVHRGEFLHVNVLRATPGVCAEVRLSIAGKSRIVKNQQFPWAVSIHAGEAIFPTVSGKYELVIDGVAGCTGHLTYTFAFNASNRGEIDSVDVKGFTSPDTAAVTIGGHNACRIRVATYRSPYYKFANTPIELVFFDPPTHLPLTVPLKRTATSALQFPGDYVVEVLSTGTKWGGAPDDGSKKSYPSFEGCVVTAPGAQDGAFVVRKTFTVTKPAGGTASNGGGSSSSGGSSPGSVPGGGAGTSSSKPATGHIASMQVPGGSFAEDEAQKIQVNGTGGCAFDLTISNKTYGGSYEQTFPVLPRKLDGGATLYNGTDFGTLAEGSWKASTAGKSGCTGNATIDFKVTPKTSTKKVAGQPTIGFDQKPKSGDTYMASKDGNIWFKVTVPQAVKDEPYASCCDVEFDYLNEYGGWEPLPSTPFTDASYGLAITQQAAVVPKSVSYFSNGNVWRMKVRAYKFKTEFDWSDWVQFKVDQH